MVRMDNNAHILRHLDNIENTLSASSETNPDAPEHLDVVVSLHDKCESKEVSAPLVIAESEFHFDLDKVFSSPMSKYEEDNLRSYDFL